MSLGAIARKLLGDRWFPVVGRLYRGVFVDLERVADSAPPLAADTAVLDVGGGDGELLNILLRRYPEARVTMIDLSHRVGTALEATLRDRVETLPGTSIREYAALGRRPPDLVIISDVVHHVPPPQRQEFFADLATLLRGHHATIMIKDVEPGSFIATLSYLADRYISGDRNTSLIGQADLRQLVRQAFPSAQCEVSGLFARNPPNYTLLFKT